MTEKLNSISMYDGIDLGDYGPGKLYHKAIGGGKLDAVLDSILDGSYYFYMQREIERYRRKENVIVSGMLGLEYVEKENVKVLTVFYDISYDDFKVVLKFPTFRLFGLSDIERMYYACNKSGME